MNKKIRVIGICICFFVVPASGQTYIKCVSENGTITLTQGYGCSPDGEREVRSYDINKNVVPSNINSQKNVVQPLAENKSENEDTFWKSLSTDYRLLPNIQFDKKYLGTLLKGSGFVFDLEYLKSENISKVTINTYTRHDKYVNYHDRYLIVLNYPGSEMALSHKKLEKNFQYNGQITKVELNEWVSQGAHFSDYYIYCTPQ